MKRCFIPFISLLLFIFLLSPAYADVIAAPDNDFYLTHRDECTHLERSFYANGKNGYVDVRHSPGGLIIYRFENGTIFHIRAQYENMGVFEYRVGERWFSGWVCLDDLVLQYDQFSFEKEFSDQIKPYHGELTELDESITTINFFSFPGSQSIVRTISINANYVQGTLKRAELTSSTENPISSIFIDEEDLTWGYINWWPGFGPLHAWFCLDDPDRNSFPTRVPVPDLIPASTPPSLLSTYLPWLLVGGLVVMTAALLCFMGLRAKKRKNEVTQ